MIDHLADYLKHLRRVHFSLVLTSATLLVAFVLTKPQDVETAIEDLDRIGFTCAAGEWNPNLLREYVNEHITSIIDGSLSNNSPKTWKPGESYEHYVKIFPYRSRPTTTTRKVRFEIVRSWIIHDTESTPISVPYSLAEFASIWDDFGTTTVTILNRPMTMRYMDSAQSGNPSDLEKQLDQLLASTNVFYLYAPEYAAFTYYTSTIGEAGRRLDVAEIYVLTERADTPREYARFVGTVDRMTKISGINARKPLAELVEVEDLRAFEDVFPELYEITKNYSDLNFEQLRLVLDGELERSGEQFEVFGTKLPGDTVTAVGPIVLVVVQLYFLLHLATFVRISAKKSLPDVPWIGSDPSLLARITTIVSSLIFPVAVVSVLNFSLGLAEHPLLGFDVALWIRWTVVSLSVVASAGLAVFSIRPLAKSVRQPPG